MHIVLNVNWLKNVNCAILRKNFQCRDIDFYVATLPPKLCCNIVSLYRNEDWYSLLEDCRKLCPDITIYVMTSINLRSTNFVATMSFFVAASFNLN